MAKQQDENKKPRGFASMEPEKQREIARKGGQASHGGHGSEHGEEHTARQKGQASHEEEHRGGKGFASMDPEKQREIARKGGQSSHSGGFASMDSEKQREIARKGGQSSHGGRGSHEEAEE